MTRVWFILLLLAALLYLPGVFNRDFYTRGEPREALVAQSMLKSGDFILGSGYGDAVPSKPPLTHWFAILCSLPVGNVSAATARLPSAFLAIAALCFLGIFLAQRYGAERGLAAGLILLTSFEWFRASVTARVDMTLAVTLLGGFVFSFRWANKECAGMPWGAILFFSLATLTKGPVSIVLPALVFACFLILEGHSLSRAFVSVCKLMVPVVCVGACWYLAAYLERRDAFLDKVWYENAQRFLGTQEDEPHKGSAVNLWGAFVAGLLPWSLFLIPWLDLRRLQPLSGLWARIQGWWRTLDSFERFSVLVVGFFLFFFSIPSSKRSVYLLPAVPFAALLLSRTLTSVNQRVHQVTARLLAVVYILLAALAASALQFSERTESLLAKKLPQAELSFYLTQYQELFSSGNWLAWGALGASLLVVLLVAVAPKSLELLPWARTPVLRAALMQAVVLYLGNAILFPAAVNSLTPRPMAEALMVYRDRGEKIYSFGSEFYGVSFYLESPIYRFEERQPKAGLVLLNKDELPRFMRAAGLSEEPTLVLESKDPVTKPGDFPMLVRFSSEQPSQTGG